LASLLFFPALLLHTPDLHAQCPNTGQTRVIKPRRGTGYYFYKFLGESSFIYFLDGETFSFNEKDDPRKTFIFIDDFAYEPTLVDRAELAKYVTSTSASDILRAQAKNQQAYFKSVIPSAIITDYGPSARKNADGSDDRLFYLWKKESPSGSTPATQYLVSTLIKDGVVVLSMMSSKGPLPEQDAFRMIEQYTSHFNTLSGEQCARALAAPTKP
jgi:hypothetical protein